MRCLRATCRSSSSRKRISDRQEEVVRWRKIKACYSSVKLVSLLTHSQPEFLTVHQKLGTVFMVPIPMAESTINTFHGSGRCLATESAFGSHQSKLRYLASTLTSSDQHSPLCVQLTDGALQLVQLHTKG